MKKNTEKEPKQLERYFKGTANARRIEILLLLAKEDSLTLDEISQNLKANIKTIHEHVKRLYQAGLVNKKRAANTIAHSLSPYGKEFVRFMKKFN